jgi:putative transposase
MKLLMVSDFSNLDIMVVQIDGNNITENLALVSAVGIDGGGGKHPLALGWRDREQRRRAVADRQSP